jgi:hypothetical protein
MFHRYVHALLPSAKKKNLSPLLQINLQALRTNIDEQHRHIDGAPI